MSRWVTGTCCRDWRPEFDPRDPRNSRELTPWVVPQPPHARHGLLSTLYPNRKKPTQLTN